MKCFYHQTSDAVGTCKNCHKGLCHECVRDIGNGVACPGTCEAAVKSMNSMVNMLNTMSSARSNFSPSRATIRGSAFTQSGPLALCGWILLVLGAATWKQQPNLGQLLVIGGIACLLIPSFLKRMLR